MPDPIATPAPTRSSASWSESAVTGVSMMVTALMTMYYWCILVNLEVPTDAQAHISLLVQYCTTGLALPANCGFYLTIYLLSGLSCDQNLLLKVAVPVMGLSWGATVYASARVGLSVLNPITRTNRFWATLAAAVISCLVFPVPLSDEYSSFYYLGLLVPNVFHNSTWLTALPFTVVIFGIGVRQLQSKIPSTRWDVIMATALVISAVFKPSFAFGFVPAYGLMLVFKTRFRIASFMSGAWPLIPVVLCIFLQSRYIAAHPEASGGGQGSTFAFAFPAGWSTFLPDLNNLQVWLLFASSSALPVLTYVLKPSWLRRTSHQLAILAVLIAFAQYMLVYEEGARAGHGNFTWQVVATLHLLYWVVLHDAFTDSWGPTRLARTRHLLLLAALGTCLISGGIYLYRITEIRNYF